MRLFVTGTGTGIGKSVVSAWLALHLDAAYWKPVQCGLDDGEGDRERIAALAGCPTFPERYRLALPRSPHHAAQAEGLRIAVRDFHAPAAERLIIEGAGGVLVPLNECEYMADLIRALDARTVVVASGGLGTINHTLLTIEALRARSIMPLCVILGGDVLPENIDAIEQMGNVPVMARIPTLKAIDRAVLSRLDFPEPLRRAANAER